MIVRTPYAAAKAGEFRAISVHAAQDRHSFVFAVIAFLPFQAECRPRRVRTKAAREEIRLASSSNAINAENGITRAASEPNGKLARAVPHFLSRIPPLEPIFSYVCRWNFP
jgi:hypothetical protein